MLGLFFPHVLFQSFGQTIRAFSSATVTRMSFYAKQTDRVVGLEKRLSKEDIAAVPSIGAPVL